MLNIQSIADNIQILVLEWEEKFKSFSNKMVMNPTNLQNRSIKQIVGHMIDSASNNTHRIVHLQYQESPLQFPNYATYGNNDRWISIQNYQNEIWETIIQLWKYSHLHISHVIRNINSEKMENEWITDENSMVTLEEMVEDFPRHLNLHLSEIEELIKQK